MGGSGGGDELDIILFAPVDVFRFLDGGGGGGTGLLLLVPFIALFDKGDLGGTGGSGAEWLFRVPRWFVV